VKEFTACWLPRHIVLPLQCAYADFFVVDTLWPDMRPYEMLDALEWYQKQDVTLGG
jgi:undecaprenyl diphosphate synthase